jgi:primase-polymerase (primpol)-like protein
MIAPALDALKAHRQFIIYRLEPSKKRHGKTDKIPCDWRTGRNADAHHLDIWLDADTAVQTAMSLGTNYGVGFVLTVDCKLFCLDIDHCLQPDNTWSPLAHNLCAMFPRAAIEISQSGHGLHIWGTYSGDSPPHGCRNIALGIELYTDERFIALGRPEGARGIAGDCTLELHSAIALFFAPDTSQPAAQEWTTAPCPEWCGPADDDELINRALRSCSPTAAFGTRASVAELWNADEEALSRAYPADGRSDGRRYDASSADAALAQHWAFWTGKNCERILRLMNRSALVREKWDRKDYLHRTILGAVARQIDVYVDERQRRRKQIEESIRIGEGSDEIRTIGTVSLEEMLARFVFIQGGQQVVDLQHPQHVAALGDWKAALRASTTIKEVKGQFNRDRTPKTKTYETATLWEKSPERKQALAVTFKAGGKLLTRDPKGREAVNIWNPFDRTVPPEDASLFLEHVDYLFGSDAGHFLDWLAHIEQRPGRLPHFGWIHISDKHGTGRNWLASVIARLWPGYAAINFDLSGMLRTGFNDRLSCKLIAVVDEIQEGGSNARWDNAETMKRLVTEEYRTINPKFGHIREEFNACRWLIFSNNIGALPLDEHDRRFNVVHNEEPPRTPDYYIRLYAALNEPAFIAGIAHMLRNRDLSSFNPGAHAAMNAAKEALIAASLGEADEILIDLVKNWPADVIHVSMLGELITGQPGAKLTRAHSHALERRGIKSHKKKIRIGETTVRVNILRNFAHWKDAGADQIRAELGRGPKTSFGGARAYLDSLTAN